MLTADVKTQIRTIYKGISTSLPNFRPRREQNYIVAEISKTLAGEYDKQRRIIVVEAGTGIGKSLAYILGSIPLALASKKKVCIATATVALQEQLLHKDLPFFLQQSGLDFTFGLVKGRQRYVCLSKLEMLVGPDNSSQMAMWQTKPDQSQVDMLEGLLKDYQDGKWNGERDTLTKPIADHLWQQIACDKHSCHRQLASHRNCPFHKAREDIDTWDVLIANHSLLFADLELGGGVILPEPEDLYYVIDEAHHLPIVARDFSSAQATIRGANDWLEKLTKTTSKLQNQIKSNYIIAPAQSMLDHIGDIAGMLNQVGQFCDAQSAKFDNPENRFRFEHGKLPAALMVLAENLATASNLALKQFNKMVSLLNEAIKDGELPKHQSEALLSETGFMLQRLENLQKLWKMMAKEDSPKGAPMARWIEQLSGKQADYLFNASPIEVGFMLENLLWDKAAGVVLCSATLRALNNFNHFTHQVGLSINDGSRYLALDSPFDFEQNATLFLPKMDCEPTDDKYTDELAKHIVALVEDESASLVLFASYWQMEKVADLVESKIKTGLLIQGSMPRQEILKQHKARCDAGKPSIIFGTGSFSEGLDLPGEYLTNLIITKLPFAVPTSPVEQAHSEYIKIKGGNPFLQLTIPDASRKLVQSCGRLLRKEQDYGRITILDRRLVTKRYGKSLLDALPPFRRVIE
ncbi:ATP-dependent DNA helicase DinG [Shewanella fidelis]|uniref:ATP-dependent DNA helicase DinG n=1 Tax=Shewanella fidelis TaxID=173509 RepID=A0AAW8NM22_9GAMM|nr:ATP-dependent DNA helicase DinG [Shewanella fidelis]MDR8523256.1 ATP-dependent DNA helicase DinG [Shewanella fidelis]MDW4811418.1 ATP-dependent DNA helicase DinG [Shewanella fidelis]MDW4815539.1 ATP-dependent DNA helicase DinG [Shewanella fidelis]MDW4819629.1 ATP-dependent DNA helicase DinG [Shewanella fidelis]MDW4824397.1 ATP-dependent DNA helicase DinG [Shewanella fidelis]